MSVPSPPHSQGLGLCPRASQGSCSETYEILMFFLSAAFKDLSQGNGTPLQYSCLENLMDRGAWQPAVPGVAQHQTQLK